MQFRKDVHASVRQPEFEMNSNHIYIRANYRKSVIPATDDEPEQSIWTYDEYYMPENEYYAVCIGAFRGPWDDILRGAEREYHYNYADKMIMKYTTDVPDETLRQAWVDYKHAVRATQDAQGYPQTVTYPDLPE